MHSDSGMKVKGHSTWRKWRGQKGWNRECERESGKETEEIRASA